MSIQRTDKRGSEQWFQLSRATAQDSRLSWEARGVLTYLLSKPNGWEWQESDLIANGPDGKHVIRRVLKELKDAGYLISSREHNPETGAFRWVKTVHERAIDRLSGDGPLTDSPSPDLPSMVEPLSGYPTMDKPTMVNQSIHKEERVQNTDSEKTEREKREKRERAAAAPPTPAPTAPPAAPHAPPGASRIEQPNIPEQPATPAAEAFRAAYPKARPLTPEQHQAIRETVTDLAVWQATLELFRLNGWRPAIGNILDRYRKDATNETHQPRRPANRHASPTSPAAGVPLGTPPPPGSRVYKPWELEEIRARREREREIADAARVHAVA